MKYLVDTDIASYAINGNSKVLSKMEANITNWAISSLTYHELVNGQMNCKNRTKELLIAEFLQDVSVVDFASADALESGRLKFLLQTGGNQIGEIGTLIAGHALSLNLTLVTNSDKHFSRVPELRIANWAK